MISAPRKRGWWSFARAAIADISTPGRRARQIAKACGATAFNAFAVHDGHIGHQVGQRLLRCAWRSPRFQTKGRAQVLRQQRGIRHADLGLGRENAQPCTGQSQRRGRKNDNAWVRARGVKYFMMGTQSSNNPCHLPASVWVIRLRSVFHQRWQPPCWPVSGLAEHPPMPSQGLFKAPSGV